jgi:hypothetical protein
VKYTRLEKSATRRSLLVLCALALATPVFAGCGDESSGETDGPTVANRVTHEFGNKPQASEDNAPLEGHETMKRLLQEYNDARFHEGKYPVSIDGHAMDTKEGTSTWASFVNGIETDPWPSEYKLYPGDVVQWDLRDWYILLDVRAIVGAFPETFTRGFEGRRIPWRVLCEKEASNACVRVRETLQKAGVKLGANPDPPTSSDQLDLTGRVVVGKWNYWRDRLWPKRIDRGPRYSGVFARFNPAGDELRLLDWNGHRVRSEGGDVGLVAAMRPTEQDFMWVVTGTNERGVMQAARALDPDRLRSAFTLAVLPDGDVKLPLEPR